MGRRWTEVSTLRDRAQSSFRAQKNNASTNRASQSTLFNHALLVRVIEQEPQNDQTTGHSNHPREKIFHNLPPAISVARNAPGLTVRFCEVCEPVHRVAGLSSYDDPLQRALRKTFNPF